MGEGLGRISFWVMLVGVNVAFLPLFLAGLKGEPVDAYKFFSGTGVSGYNLVATIQQNPILSFAFAAVLVPALWKWVRKNCFPNSSE